MEKEEGKVKKKRFEPKIGQYFYELWKKGMNEYWRVYQHMSEGEDRYVKDFQYYEKSEAIDYVGRLNGWVK